MHTHRHTYTIHKCVPTAHKCIFSYCTQNACLKNHSAGCNKKALFSRLLLFIASLISSFISFYSSPFRINFMIKMSKLVRESYEKKEKDSASIDRLQASRWASEDEVSHALVPFFPIFILCWRYE